MAGIIPFMDSLFNFDPDAPNEAEKSQERADFKTRFKPGNPGGPGRPLVKLTKRDYKIVEGLVLSGNTNERIATIMGWNEDTFYILKQRDARFSELLSMTKEKADEMITASLFQRANGYRYKEKKIKSKRTGGVIEESTEIQYKEMPPDVRAAQLWLMNRNPDKWKEKPEGNTQVNNNTNIVQHKVDWTESAGCDPLSTLPNEAAGEAATDDTNII